MGDQVDAADLIESGRTAVGIELGSTRIKAVLIGPDSAPLATGGHDWDNQFVDRMWTYDLDAVWEGLRAAWSELAAAVQARYGVPLTTLGSIGFSAMMHGYLAFDADDELLVPFRTWRNTNTGAASRELTELFRYNVPQRWSIAHLLQAIRNGEPHVDDVAYLTTLSGYVHWRLTGRQVLGIGDASGMFPIDTSSARFDEGMLTAFDGHVAARGLPWRLRDILPEVLVAGQDAGRLTAEGARLLDPTGTLQAGVPAAPPEGDAGTGMVATNSVAVRTGNVSAGTSIFAMIVLEEPPARVHEEIDLVTTPSGDLVGMVHCNNCTSDLNAWVGLFGQVTQLVGVQVPPAQLFETLYRAALDAEPDAGGLLAYNYVSGEHITGLEEGRPLFVRAPDSAFTIANFMRAHLFAALATLRVGMDVLRHEEGVRLDRIFAHGGLFKTPLVGQSFLAAALDTPVGVGEIAGEGGAWGMALLAAFLQEAEKGRTLAEFLDAGPFATVTVSSCEPRAEDVAGFGTFMERYRRGIPVETAAVRAL